MSEKGYNNNDMKDGVKKGKHSTLFRESVYQVKTPSVIQGDSDRHRSVQPNTGKVIVEQDP